MVFTQRTDQGISEGQPVCAVYLVQIVRYLRDGVMSERDAAGRRPASHTDAGTHFGAERLGGEELGCRRDIWGQEEDVTCCPGLGL